MAKNRSNYGNGENMGKDPSNGDSKPYRESKRNARGKKNSYDFAADEFDDDARFIDSDSFDDMDSSFLDSEDGVVYYEGPTGEQQSSETYLQHSFLYDADSFDDEIDDVDDDFDDDFDEDFEQLPDDEFLEMVSSIDEVDDDDIDEDVDPDPNDEFDEMAADEDVYDGDEQI